MTFSKLYIIAATFISVTAYSQVAVGKNDTTNPSVSLEFGTGAKGLILPYVTDAAQMQNPVPGTIIMDAQTGIVQYKTGGNTWQPLSLTGTDLVDGRVSNIGGNVSTAIQQGKPDVTSSASVIGTAKENIPGVLILSDVNKAMILPKMESPHLNIISPAAGMIAYDTKTKQLAVFNGTVWTFWSAAE